MSEKFKQDKRELFVLKRKVIISMQDKTVSRFRTLTDTSSVVAHDLCAQLHVIQFCLEELADHVGPQGKEYLKRMGASTNYISHLVDSFRRGLKVSLSDDRHHPLSDVYDGFIELIKSHYFVVLEKIKFEVEGNLGDFTAKVNSRQLLHQLFALYSFYIDELKASLDDKENGQECKFLLVAEPKNSRFINLKLTVEGVLLTQEEFQEKLSQTVEEKGKIRQFLGGSLIKEALNQDSDYLHFYGDQKKNIISITLPIEQGE